MSTAGHYRLLLHFEEGVYFGSAVEMPYVMAEGADPDVCVRATYEALAVGVATLLEQGRQPPPPADEHKRTEQVNVRLSKLERLRLEQASRREGFRGLSDFIRRKALENV